MGSNVNCLTNSSGKPIQIYIQNHVDVDMFWFVIVDVSRHFSRGAARSLMF